ncbi:Protein vip1 [Conoideocrella luteorostrata]|uniref:Protein vip1 n=1 Tax=Conoideocrella luteorostrata TaxID=1105319 RepID=A0AAJ0CE58_9HYPO|nr:Protein vip1 [Conoideocrella luteorostrata]
MATTPTVHVKNIAAVTSDAEIKTFFSFCGKISDFKVTPDPDGELKSADVTFEKETAMKTALLLNSTQLGPNHISVVSADGSTDDDGSHFTKNEERDSDEITQEEKPRTRILAEYLANGYVVGDVAIERAIQLDTQHKVSTRFLNTIQNIDQKYHATDRAKATDQSYGITQRANSFLTGIGSYFEKASNSPTGKKIVQFYTDSSRQVQDIHTEARRLADLKKEQHGGSAYRAAGLERVFGKEAPKESAKETSSASAGTGSGGGVGVGATAGSDAGATTNPAVGAEDNTTAASAVKTADEKAA